MKAVKPGKYIHLARKKTFKGLSWLDFLSGNVNDVANAQEEERREILLLFQIIPIGLFINHRELYIHAFMLVFIY